MKTYGITGGIGMGKSTVAKIIAERGMVVVDTDDLARQLVRPGEPALAEIKNAFGPGVFLVTGELDRDALAGIVFRDEVARKELEAILHPRIQHLWKLRLATARDQGQAHAAVVIPLLFETGAECELDLVICVGCSIATQLDRLRSRGWTPDQIRQRIAAQMPLTDKMARAQRVIWNEGDLDVLARQCHEIISPAI